MKTLPGNHSRNREYVIPDQILLATNMDDDYLLPHAIAQARASGATLTIVHVTPPAESIPLDASAIYSADAAAITVEARWVLEGMAAKAYSSGVPCNPLVCQGSPQSVVPKLVKTCKTDRLILGTYGRRQLKKVLLGSVAEEILNNVEVPVCIIGPNAHTTSAHGKPKRILHPISLRPGYEESARFAFEMAQFYQAEITLLHVLDRKPGRDYEAAHAEEWTRSQLQRLVPDEALLWTYVNAQVEVGGVVDHILDIAAEMQADLIVLGVGAERSLWPVPGDGTAYTIIAQASCPVFTFRHCVSADLSKIEMNTQGMFAGTF